MKREVLSDLIHRLIEIEPSSSPLVSCFANLDEPRWSLLDQLDDRREALGRFLAPRQRVDFMDGCEAIATYLRDSIRPSTRGVALYSRWGAKPVMVAVQFERPLSTNLIVDDLPHIYPLIELKDRFDRFVIVITDETEARILETTIGSVTKAILGQRANLRHRVGREWTREHYRSFRSEQRRSFVREKLRIVESLMGKRGRNHLIVTGNPRMADRMIDALPSRLLKRLVAVLPAEPKNGLDPILAHSLDAFIAAEQSESRRRGNELVRAVLRGGLGVAGVMESRRALFDGVADRLVIDQDYGDAVQREELVRAATERGIPVEAIRHDVDLKRSGGVGCFLRFRSEGTAAGFGLEWADQAA